MANYIKNLPEALLTDIVARVASSSAKDYFKVKVSWKLFKKAGEDEFVYKHMSFDEVPVFSWHGNVNEATNGFINRCIESENPDALYRKGMAEYFARDNAVTAIEYLSRAVLLGHNGALYVYNLILLGKGCYQDYGSELFSLMKRTLERGDGFTFYRKHVGELVLSIMLRSPSKTFDYCTTEHNGVNDEPCVACLCDEEIYRAICCYLDSIQR